MTDAHAAAAQMAARDAYGRLVALVTRRTGDVAGAEDALSEAFVAALERWPRDGVPDNPQGWLLAVARRRHVDQVRHSEVQRRLAPALQLVAEELSSASSPPDRRLPLLFMCAHPSIAAAVRAPLMLQAVLGLTAQHIGQAFLVAPTTMGQRLSRAKHKIRAAKIPFEPAARWSSQLHRDRLAVVCEAIYAAFTTGHRHVNPHQQGLALEAVWLARLVHRTSHQDPETGGLLAMMLHIEARRMARRDPQGRYVPLDTQDPSLWDRERLREAEGLLWQASHQRRPGRFQLEAAIQSAHAHRAISGRTDWVAIEMLYRELLTQADTLGARIAHLAALAEAHSAECAYDRLLQLPKHATATHQAYWALRAHLEHRLGRDPCASASWAIKLSDDHAVQAFLGERFGVERGVNPESC